MKEQNYDDIEIADMNLLHLGYLASRRGSSWKPEVQKFRTNYLTNLRKIHDDLYFRTYEISPRNVFVIKERGKVRVIHGSKIRDRVVQHSFADNVLSPSLEKYLIYENCASRPNKGVGLQRKIFERHLHNYYLEYRDNVGYVVFIDFKKFYDNIRHDVVKELVYPKITSEGAWLMDRILESFEIDVSYMSWQEYSTCMNKIFDSVNYYRSIQRNQKNSSKMMKKSLNIGDQIAQDLGIYLPTRIDTYCRCVLGLKYYGRYMDDIAFIARNKDDISFIIDGIKRIASSLGLFVNDRKTRIYKLSSTYKFLQIRYSLTKSGKVIKRLSQKNVCRERKRLKSFKRLLNRGILSQEEIDNCYKAWMGNYAKIMSKEQIKNMKMLYFDLFGKELRWKKK